MVAFTGRCLGAVSIEVQSQNHADAPTQFPYFEISVFMMDIADPRYPPPKMAVWFR